MTYARLAQLVERFIYTEDVAGSSPASRTKTQKPAKRRFCALCETERCFVSTRNRESGSRNFYCADNKNIRDHKSVCAVFLWR